MAIAGGVGSVEHLKVYVQAAFCKVQVEIAAMAFVDYLWPQECPVSDAICNAKINMKTGAAQNCCSHQLYLVVVVQVDESLFRHKPKTLTIP